MKKLKITEREFKIYLLENYIDENGNKISDRELWSKPSFFEYTGMYSIDKYTKEKKIISTGSISYWKSKLNLKEKDVFLYHKNVTKKIDKNVDYDKWSKLNNKGHKKINIYNENTIKRNLIKYVGLSNSYNKYSPKKIQEIVFRFWESMGLDATVEMNKFYSYMKGGEIDG